MTGNEYQWCAGRTINRRLDFNDLCFHALCGICSESGEIMSLYQHMVQESKPLAKDKLQKEIGDLLWFIAELCTAYGWDLDDIGDMNIEKLRKRYPEGFDAERSANRHALEDAEEK